MVWYEEFNFTSNPFTIKPQEGYEDFLGQKELVKKVVHNVEKGSITIVFGEYGTGKTTVMKGIIDKFRGERKVAYYNCYTSEKSIDYEDILIQGGSRLSSFFGLRSKNMILLLDEAHNLMPRDFENLVDYYNEGFFRSIVLVTSRPGYKFPKDVLEIVDGHMYELKRLTEEDAIQLVKSRLEGVEIISDDMIKKILKNAKTPREFLMRCDDACRKATARGSEVVEVEDIE